ncbi:MAG: DUF167 domain-containing protein [Halobacteriovoraceae bacterium]|jgi:uncharacterized protein|nr:DUF167 domain-containing protein [Halobacteriovoraceae bacterium]MBT5096156.1 DUF167 domain-containing protein [Halobacteriovoraceae bacterium]
MKINVIVKTNSKKEGVTEEVDGPYTVRINTPPVDGKANKRVIELLAKHLGVAKTSISLHRGGKSKEKVFVVSDSF